MRLLTALLTVLALIGFAGTATAACSGMKDRATTADNDEPLIPPGQTS